MFEVYRKEITWGGRLLTLETGKIARQADGAVMITYGGTQVLCTAVGASTAKPGIDFFPLTVNYQEKAFAAGRIPGGFFKREGRPSEKETLVCRLIDRPIRPLFHKSYKNETQIIATVLAHDMENDPDIISLIGASAALTISGLPFMGPIGACRVGWDGEKYILNPTTEQMKNATLDLVVAGTKKGVLMVESEASELSEEIMLGAVDFGHKEMGAVIKAIIELAEVAAKEPRPLAEEPKEQKEYLKILKPSQKKFEKAYKEMDKSKRSKMLSEIRNEIILSLGEKPNMTLASSLTKNIEAEIVRGSILKTKKRIDGRDTTTVRPIVAEVGTLPRAHGSALFTRGETQALVVATLGTGQDEQIIDALDGEYRENFMLHYNFPPYSVGEAGRVGSPGRREIGHGKLAWRALHPLLPVAEDFPYTVRIVSEVTESNGSSSMATVCGASLALMDAGVPIKKPVAGIAMGLIKEKDDFSVLSDILGDEDHLGDMDFKVAGTVDGITSLQMDIKITSITKEIMEIALGQAKDGRIHILNEMSKAIKSSREALADTAPKITTMKIKVEKIRDVIGPGGKMIREICELTGAKVDIEDDGTIKIAASDTESSLAAQKKINDIVAEAELGVIYDGKVVKTVDFGAFVNFLGSKDGLVHISELQNARTEKTTDICKEGDEVKVKVIGFDDRGKVKLSMKRVNQETGEDIESIKEE
ncbi:MAG: polyribonucleotide nucleotidyltransferase [Proteobacteria bacterium]|nr:polyribonucleotide nucleotidyltransferase [Pseudomonadota bacterium]MDA1135442.1 polyribonucleotide nucleotidyltransferase [Pseudomonadota bacterium]